MAATDYGVNAPEAVKLWSKALAREALKKTFIGQFIGQGSDALLQEKTELKKGAGDRVRVTLRMQLSGDGVSEGETQEGQEEALTTYTDDLTINELSHAVRSRSKISRQRVSFNVRDEAKDGLADWYAERMDVSMFNHLCGYTAESRLKFTGLNAVVAPDAAHIIRKTGLTTDQAVQGDATAIFTTELIDRAKVKATTVAPLIRPIKIKGRNKYVMFLHTFQVHQLRQSAATAGSWADIQKAALQGGQISDNPIYTGALGEWNDVILHEATRVTNGVHSTSGAAQTSVRRAVLCGAQSGLIAFGEGQGFENWDWVEEMFDYKRELGVSAQTIFGMKKTRFNGADFGTVVVSTYSPDPNA